MTTEIHKILVIMVVKLYFITKNLGNIHCSFSVRKLIKCHSKHNFFVLLKEALSVRTICFFLVQKYIRKSYLPASPGTDSSVCVFLSPRSRIVLMKDKPENINYFWPLSL